MRKLAALLLIAATLSCGMAPRDYRVADTLRSLVKVTFVSPDADGNPQTHVCTGFVVDAARGWVATAKHCIPDSGDVLVDGAESEVVASDESFALLTFERMTKPPLEFDERLEVQESVWAFGYAWGDMFVFARHVARIDGDDFATDTPFAPGMSGGPVVDINGKVVGLIQASNNVIGVACGAKELRTFIRKAMHR